MRDRRGGHRREGRRRGPGHRARQPGGRRPPGAAHRVRACLRAVRRHHHGAQRRLRDRSSRRARRSRRPSSSASRRSIRCASSCTCRRPTHSTCASARPPTSRCVSSRDRVFEGTVTRTAGAIDPASGTLLTEVQVPNHDGALLSGAYVTVHFKLHRDGSALLIPGTALLVNAAGNPRRGDRVRRHAALQDRSRSAATTAIRWRC